MKKQKQVANPQVQKAALRAAEQYKKRAIAAAKTGTRLAPKQRGTWGWFVFSYRVVAAIAIAAAIIVQLHESHARGPVYYGNFFGYFTIQSNILGMIALLWAAFATRKSQALTLLRGAATLYLAITGVVFALLLSNVSAELGNMSPWVNAVLHQILPVLIVFDWLVDPPYRRLPFRQTVWWLVYPIAWLAGTLVRGAHTHWYPYPFVNPNKGYGRVALYCLAIAVFTVAASWVVGQVGRLRRAQA